MANITIHSASKKKPLDLNIFGAPPALMRGALVARSPEIEQIETQTSTGGETIRGRPKKNE